MQFSLDLTISNHKWKITEGCPICIHLFPPHKAHTTKPAVASDVHVDSLKSFLFIDDGNEMVNSCQFGLQPLEKYCLFSQVLLLLSVFFCLLVASFNDQQDHSLQDYMIETCLMLQYNKH